MSHTPTLKLAVKTESDHIGWKGISILDQDGLAIANMVMCLKDGERAKAQHIVHCVNSHNALVEASNALLEAIAYVPGIEAQRRALIEAIAAAEKGAPCKP